jgi:hypothetical protein
MRHVADCLPRDTIEASFAENFGVNRSKGGLECKFYRTLRDNGIPEQVREQIKQYQGRSEERIRQFGAISRQPQRYPWMLSRDRATVQPSHFNPHHYPVARRRSNQR